MRGGERGFIIVAVVWICGALSALVLIYMNFVAATAQATAAFSDRPQVEALTSAGIELAASRVLSEPRPARGDFDARIGPHRIAVTFVSEAARIDLNAAPKRVVANLFVALGASADAARFYADRIAAWRTPAEDGDSEMALYRAAGIAHAPRRAPFPLPEELWLVAGIPDQFVARALPYLTTFTNQPSADPAVAEAFVRAALQGDQAAATSKAYRVTVVAMLDNGQRDVTEAVILVFDGTREPYRVLAWRDMIDASSPQATR